MKIKEYSDGSVYTEKHLAASVLGGIALTGLYFGTKAATQKLVNMRTVRKQKKADRDNK